MKSEIYQQFFFGWRASEIEFNSFLPNQIVARIQ